MRKLENTGNLCSASMIMQIYIGCPLGRLVIHPLPGVVATETCTGSASAWLTSSSANTVMTVDSAPKRCSEPGCFHPKTPSQRAGGGIVRSKELHGLGVWCGATYVEQANFGATAADTIYRMAREVLLNLMLQIPWGQTCDQTLIGEPFMSWNRFPWLNQTMSKSN